MIFYELKMKSVLLFLTCILYCLTGTGNGAKAQEVDYARYIMDTLSAPGLYGRGYVNFGSLQASQFITRQLFDLGVRPFSDSYAQEFSFPVNTFPGSMMLNISGRELMPGVEFVVRADCPAVNGVYKIVILDSADFANQKKLEKILRKDLRHSLLSFDKSLLKGASTRQADSMLRTNYPGAGGYLLVNPGEKLIWSVSPGYRQLDYPVVEVVGEALPRKPENVAITVDAEFYPTYRVMNIAGYLEGKKYPDSMLVFTAHYDHLGMMGRTARFPGANDNASGVAMMLDFARHFAGSANRPDYSLAFLAFAGEEMGLKGSEYFAENPVFPLERIKFLINLDMVGTGSEGITVVNGTIFPEYYRRMVQINADNEYILKVAERGESCNSDHCPFYRKGVPSVFIYSMGKEHMEYHTLYDLSQRVPLSEYEDIFRLLRDFILTF